jgi:TolB-like protein/DNA-binding winged helix-turn-helix (wHTH) protein/Flp pilus assembly protein TadD
MATPEKTGQAWCFGVYDVDTRRAELCRNGKPVRLRDQSFVVLVTLLEHAGEVVTREDLRHVLWPSDVFVDFDHSLSMAILKLREALSDSTDKPRYIETVPKKGYRFIALVSRRAGAVDELDNSGCLPEDSSDTSGGAQHSRWTSLPVWKVVLLACSGLVAIAGILLVLHTWRMRDRALLRGSEGAGVSATIQSIAVLPLDNLSDDRGQEYFADGLTDELITDLGQIETMRVISRTSVMRYKRSKTPLSQIGHELGVDAVVEGTVQRSGSRVRISVQLLDAHNDRHIWAETYERDLGDVIVLERQMALAIAHEIGGLLEPGQEMLLTGTRPINLRAYDAYLRGRYLFAERTAEAETSARVCFEEALSADPNSALPYTGLADFYTVGWFVKNDYPLAEQYARKAVALRPDLAEAHASLGIAATNQHKFNEAEGELKEAIRLNSNYVMAHHWYSLTLLALGRPNEALAENDRARELDPFSLPVNYLRGIILLGLQRYDRAATQLETAASLGPPSPSPHEDLLRIDWIQGKVIEALAEQRKLAALTNDSTLLHDEIEIAAEYRNAGLRAAEVKAARLKEKGYYRDRGTATMPAHNGYGAFSVALQYGILQKPEETLAWLDRAGRENSTYFTMAFMTAPEFKFLRSDPRFQNLLRRVGVAK